MSQTDGECVRLCLDGHPEMFRHLVVRYEGPLLRHLAGRLGDEDVAAEAAQETLVRAYFALGKLKKPESFYCWLRGIADRVAREMQRAKQRHVTSIELEAVSDKTEAAPGHGDRPDSELNRAVAELPDTYREVILLRFYGGQSCAEISSNLGVSLGTITSRLSRAYALLRKTLREHDQDVEVKP